MMAESCGGDFVWREDGDRVGAELQSRVRAIVEEMGERGSARILAGEDPERVVEEETQRAVALLDALDDWLRLRLASLPRPPDPPRGLTQ
jgi:hypothetical protein